MKKLLVLGLVLVLAVSVFFTSHTVAPEKVEALWPTVGYIIMHSACCEGYASTCPKQVRYRCYSDCMSQGQCFNGL